MKAQHCYRLYDCPRNLVKLAGNTLIASLKIWVACVLWTLEASTYPICPSCLLQSALNQHTPHLFLPLHTHCQYLPNTRLLPRGRLRFCRSFWLVHVHK